MGTAACIAMAYETTPDGLLALVAEGDRKALAGLYDRFAPHMLGIIRQILSDRKESEQVLEEIFVKLWHEAADVVRAGASVAAWLVLGARAAAEEHLRSRTATDRAAGRRRGSARAQMLAWLPTPEAIDQIEQRKPLLQKALGHLPARQLRGVELLAFGGRTESELGRELGEPSAKVRSDLLAAAHFLRHRRRAVVGSWAVSL